MKEYKDDSDVLWRACTTLTSIGLIDDEICFEIVSHDVHNIVAEAFFLPEFESETRVRQQILWMMNTLLKGFKARRRIHQVRGA